MFKASLALCSACAPAASRMALPRALRATVTVRVSGRRMLSSSSEPVYKEGKHRSNAERLVNSVPVIEVPGHVAICDGGSGALGHPVEYIQLDTVSNKPAICKYCGLRFKMGEVHHH